MTAMKERAVDIISNMSMADDFDKMPEKFDYTKWQRDYFDFKTPEEISREAAEYDKMNPYTGNAFRV